MEERKETRSNEKVSKECGKGEHEEERHGAVLQTFGKYQELLCAALARVREAGGNEMLKIPFGAERASESMVEFLLLIGVLYTDETGIRASKPGIYKLKIPTQTANPSGD